MSLRQYSPAALVAGPHKLIGAGLALTLLLFPVVLFVPLLTTKVYFVSYNDIALARVAYELFQVDKFLFVVVFGFGIVLPAIKMFAAALCWFVLPLTSAHRIAPMLSLLGKLSMLDVMLLALIIIGFKGVGIGRVEIRYGLYLYALLVVASLLLNLLMARAVDKAQAAGAMEADRAE